MTQRSTGINRIENSAQCCSLTLTSQRAWERGAGSTGRAGAAAALQGRAGSEHEERAPHLPQPRRAPAPPGPTLRPLLPATGHDGSQRLLPPPKAPSPGPVPWSRAVSSRPFPSERCKKGSRGRRRLGLQLPACSVAPPPRHATSLTAGSNGPWGKVSPPSCTLSLVRSARI